MGRPDRATSRTPNRRQNSNCRTPSESAPDVVAEQAPRFADPARSSSGAPRLERKPSAGRLLLLRWKRPVSASSHSGLQRGGSECNHDAAAANAVTCTRGVHSRWVPAVGDPCHRMDRLLVQFEAGWGDIYEGRSCRPPRLSGHHERGLARDANAQRACLRCATRVLAWCFTSPENARGAE